MDWDKIYTMTFTGVVSGDAAYRIYKYWLTKDEKWLTEEDKVAIEDYING